MRNTFQVCLKRPQDQAEGIKAWGMEIYILKENIQNRTREKVVVEKVVFGSTAHLAGIEPSDEIIGICGGGFASSTQLYQLMSNMSEVELTICRDTIENDTLEDGRGGSYEVANERGVNNVDVKTSLSDDNVNQAPVNVQSQLNIPTQLEHIRSMSNNMQDQDSTNQRRVQRERPTIFQEPSRPSPIKSANAKPPNKSGGNDDSSNFSGTLLFTNSSYYATRVGSERRNFDRSKTSTVPIKKESDLHNYTSTSYQHPSDFDTNNLNLEPIPVPSVCRHNSRTSASEDISDQSSTSKGNVNDVCINDVDGSNETNSTSKALEFRKKTLGTASFKRKASREVEKLFEDVDEDLNEPIDTAKKRKKQKKEKWEEKRGKSGTVLGEVATVTELDDLSIVEKNEQEPINGSALKRLWPDIYTFIKRLLKLRPPSARLENSKCKFYDSIERVNDADFIASVPATFENYSEIVKYYTPLILDEAIASLNCQKPHDNKWNLQVFKFRLQAVANLDIPDNKQAVHKLYELSFTQSGDCTMKYTDIPDSLNDLFVLFSPSWSKSCFGITGVADPLQSMGKSNQEDLKLWVCGSDTSDGTGWIQASELHKMRVDGTVELPVVFCMYLGNLATNIREFEGLKSLKYVGSSLKKAVFTKSSKKGIQKIVNESPITNLSDVPRPSSIPENIWRRLEREHNKLQLHTIERTVARKPSENIILIQGPPGTGKSSTITGIVTAMLSSGGVSSADSTAKAGIKVKVGQSLPNFRQDKVSSRAATSSTRILVCAPSNKAVDDICWKIWLHSKGEDGKKQTFKIIRYGKLPTSHPDTIQQGFLTGVNLDRSIEKKYGVNNNNNNRSRRKKSETSEVRYTEERRIVLSSAQIVCTTLSGAGSKAFIDAVSSSPPSLSNCHNRSNATSKLSEFDVLIIDEACQASEPLSLIPFKFNPKVVILVGDPKQLPVLCLSRNGPKYKYDRSLFERLYDNGKSVIMLRQQYRMHPSISLFPSTQFYHGALVPSKMVLDREPSPWHESLCFPPYLIWNMAEGKMESKRMGRQIFNADEDDFIMKKMLPTFLKSYGRANGAEPINIGIITFYREQALNMQKILQNENIYKKTRNIVCIEASTVDGFQGAEKDIIILSCVRSHRDNDIDEEKQGSIGFLRDYRRLNVAITRAKRSLWIVGNCDYILNRDPVWRSLLDTAQQKNLVAHCTSFDHIASFPTTTTETQSSSKNYSNKISWKPHHKKARRKHRS